MLGRFGIGEVGILLVHIGHQRRGHAEHGVGIDVLVALQIQRRDHFAIAGRADDEVNVRGPIAVTLLRANHVAHRAVHRDHVAERRDGAQVETAVGVGMEGAAQVHLGRIVLLQIVVAGFVRLPDLHRGVRNALAGGVGHASVEADFQTVGGLGDDGIAQLQDRANPGDRRGRPGSIWCRLRWRAYRAARSPGC